MSKRGIRSFVILACAALAAAGFAQSPAKVRTGEVELAYRTFGPEGGASVLLIQGVGGEMPLEPDGFLARLVEDGLQVIVFDNRDVGASTHMTGAETPSAEEVQSALAAGRAPDLPYTLRDMAGDAVALLDELQLRRVHLVGGSAGGMIAQLVAADNPDRVRTLTLISSSNNAPGLPAPSGGEGFDDLPENHARQALAATFAGDLRAADRAISVPTVVIHGTEDDVFPLAHGRSLAMSIPNAQLVVIAGMGHVPESAHDRQIADAIQGVLGRSEATSRRD
jgi:pimeloyl-ACP methyl ester carboxylesterase